MQPTIIISAPQPGIIYLNGRFAGEVSENMSVMRPVNPQGAVYIEYRPLTNACRSMARKIVLSGGIPLRESIEEAEDIFTVAWPNGVLEAELTPEAVLRTVYIPFEAGGRQFAIESGARQRLMLAGHVLAELPEGAEAPEFRRMESGSALLGSCRDGMYLLCTDHDFSHVIGFLTALHIEIESDSRVRALTSRRDLTGHALLESWKLKPEGLVLENSQSAWANGAPHWPQTPAETAYAAAEAAMEELYAEAEEYLTPALRGKQLPQRIREQFDLCTDMKYGVADGRSCIALLRLEGGNFASAHPMYYRASASGGIQGPYRLESLEFDN